MSFPRCLEPEWLDQLPPEDPRAIRSRRDLKRINALMGHVRIMARCLLEHAGNGRPRVLVDLGAGDGSFTLEVARRVAPHWPGMTAILVDRQSIVRPEVRDAFASLGWKLELVAADLFDYLARPEHGADIVTANLFLHHFSNEQLARLLAVVERWPRLFVACEPRRSTLVREASRLLWALGCNDVSIHDAVASTRAGFRNRELSALWPASGGWQLRERAAGPFSHCFVARRASQGAPSSAVQPGSG
jgi:hypothetical protein